MPARSGTHGAFAGCRRPLRCSEQSHRLSGRRAGVTAGPARLPGTAEPLPETRKPRACTRGSRASFTTAESGSGPKSAERCTGKENVAPANTGASLSHDRAGTRDAPPRRPHREPGPGARAWIRNARLPECPAPAVFTGLQEPLAVFAFGPAHLRGGPITCGVRTPRLPSAPVYVCGRVPFARHHSTFHIFAEGLSVRLRAAAALGAGCCRGRRGPGRGPGQAPSCPPACPGHSRPHGFCGPDTGLGLLPALFQEPLQG